MANALELLGLEESKRRNPTADELLGLSTPAPVQTTEVAAPEPVTTEIAAPPFPSQRRMLEGRGAMRRVAGIEPPPEQDVAAGLEARAAASAEAFRAAGMPAVQDIRGGIAPSILPAHVAPPISVQAPLVTPQPSVLQRVLGVSPQQAEARAKKQATGQRAYLEEVAAETGIPVERLEERVRAALDRPTARIARGFYGEAGLEIVPAILKALGLGLPEDEGPSVMDPDGPATAAVAIPEAAGRLAGFMTTPLALGRRAVEATIGRWLAPATVDSAGAILAKHVAREAATLSAGSVAAAAGRAAEQPSASEGLGELGRAARTGAALGVVFGGAKGVLPGNDLMGRSARLGLGLAAADAVAGRHPGDDRDFAQKAFDYGLNAFFLFRGRSPERVLEGIRARAVREGTSEDVAFRNEIIDLAKDVTSPDEFDRLVDVFQRRGRSVEDARLAAAQGLLQRAGAGRPETEPQVEEWAPSRSSVPAPTPPRTTTASARAALLKPLDERSPLEQRMIDNLPQAERNRLEEEALRARVESLDREQRLTQTRMEGTLSDATQALARAAGERAGLPERRAEIGERAAVAFRPDVRARELAATRPEAQPAVRLTPDEVLQVEPVEPELRVTDRRAPEVAVAVDRPFVATTERRGVEEAERFPTVPERGIGPEVERRERIGTAPIEPLPAPPGPGFGVVDRRVEPGDVGITPPLPEAAPVEGAEVAPADAAPPGLLGARPAVARLARPGFALDETNVNVESAEELVAFLIGRGGIRMSPDFNAPFYVKARREGRRGEGRPGVALDEIALDIARAQGRPVREIEDAIVGTLGSLDKAGATTAKGTAERDVARQRAVPQHLTEELGVSQDAWDGMTLTDRRTALRDADDLARIDAEDARQQGEAGRQESSPDEADLSRPLSNAIKHGESFPEGSPERTGWLEVRDWLDEVTETWGSPVEAWRAIEMQADDDVSLTAGAHGDPVRLTKREQLFLLRPRAYPESTEEASGGPSRGETDITGARAVSSPEGAPESLAGRGPAQGRATTEDVAVGSEAAAEAADPVAAARARVEAELAAGKTEYTVGDFDTWATDPQAAAYAAWFEANQHPESAAYLRLLIREGGPPIARERRAPYGRPSVFPVKEVPSAKFIREKQGYTEIVEVDARRLKDIFEGQSGEVLPYKEERLQPIRGRAHQNAYVQIDVKDGQVHVNDGRHRLAVAAERGQRIQVVVKGKDAAAELRNVVGETLRTERTPEGDQGLIPGAPKRAMPTTRIKPPKPQKPVEDTPLFGQEKVVRDRESDESQGTLFSPVQTSGTTGIAIRGRGGRVIAGSMYKGNIPQVAVKEAIQNSLDAILALPSPKTGHVRVNYDSGTNTLTIEDNGIGMTQKVATTELMEIGESDKPAAGSAGAFGLAKAVLFGHAAEIDIVTRAAVAGPARQASLFERVTARAPRGETRIEETRVTGSGEDWGDKSLKWTSEDDAPSGPTGTKLTVRFTDEIPKNAPTVRDYLESFLRTVRHPTRFDFTIDGTSVTVPAQDRVHLLRTLTVPGATVEMLASAEASPTQYVMVNVLNNGIPQFRMAVYLKRSFDMPNTVVADVHATVEATALDYPFLSNRESLRDAVRDKIEGFVKREMLAQASDAERAKFQKIIASAPKLGPKWVLVDGMDVLDKDLVRTVAQAPSVRRVVAEFDAAFRDLQDAVVRDNPVYAQAEVAGAIIHRSWLGVNLLGSAIHGPGSKNPVFFNPFLVAHAVERDVAAGFTTPQAAPRQFAARAAHVALHELAHQAARSEDANFTAALADLDGKTFDVRVRATQALASLMEDGDGFRYRAIVKLANDTEALPAWGAGVFGQIGAHALAPRERGDADVAGEGAERGARPEEALRRGGVRASVASGAGLGGRGPAEPGVRPEALAERRAAYRATVARPAFIRWFGVSMVVDEDGSAKVVHHGTGQPGFDTIDPEKLDPDALYGPGFYMTEDPAVAGGVVRDDTEIRFFATREEAEAAPQRSGFVWSTGPEYGADAGKWAASIKVPVTEKRGYAHKAPARSLTPDEIGANVEAIRGSREYARMMERGYLSAGEREVAERDLGEYERTGNTMYLDLLSGQPYNLNWHAILERAGLVGAGGVYPVYARIERPFDIDGILDEGARSRILDAIDRRFGRGASDYARDRLEEAEEQVNITGDLIYREILRNVQDGQGMPIDKVGVTDTLRDAGYDGITHIGGGRSGGTPHRVWVAFEPEQVKSAIGNRGTFDPEDRSLLREGEAGYAPLRPAPFYSQAVRAVEQKMPNAAPAPVVRNILRTGGVKDEEIRWTGLGEWLDQQGTRKVTKDEVLGFLRDNEVRVEIKRLGGPNPDQAEYDRLTAERRALGIAPDWDPEHRRRVDEIDRRANEIASQTEPPKFNDPRLNLPGAIPGTYVELLGKLPERERGETLAGEAAGGTPVEPGYVEPHFQEPNVVFHVRGAEHLDAQGRRGFVVEEAQSQWTATGRKHGFKVDRLPPDYRVTARADGEMWDVHDAQGLHVSQAPNRQAAVQNALDVLASRAGGDFRNAVPPHPFIKSWHERAMKEAIEYALALPPDAQGRRVEWIGWTPGQVQADRYDLSKHVDAIRYWREDGYWQITLHRGGGRALENFPREIPDAELEQAIGKDIAEKMRRGQGTVVDRGPRRELSGLDLKIGGEWAINLYDQKIPNFVRGYIKKWGGRLGENDVNTGNTGAQIPDGAGGLVRAPGEGVQIQRIHAFDVTDSMRRSIREEGQAAFQRRARYTRDRADTRPEQLSLDAYADFDRVRRDAEGGAVPDDAGRLPVAQPGGAPGARPGEAIRVLGAAISDQLADTGHVTFRGLSIERGDPASLAVLLQPVRNPKFETFRVFAVKGIEIVGEEAVTARLPAAAPLPWGWFGANSGEAKLWARDFVAMMRERGADGFWHSHNHPGGLPKPSRGDLNAASALATLITETARELGVEAPTNRGHVIIDSGAYGFIGPGGKHSVSDLPGAFLLDPILRPSVYHPVLGERLTDPADLAAIGATLKNPASHVSIVVSRHDDRGSVSAIASMPVEVFTGPRTAELLRDLGRAYGSDRVFAYYDGPADLVRRVAKVGRRLVAERVLADVGYGEPGRSPKSVLVEGLAEPWSAASTLEFMGESYASAPVERAFREEAAPYGSDAEMLAQGRRFLRITGENPAAFERSMVNLYGIGARQQAKDVYAKLTTAPAPTGAPSVGGPSTPPPQTTPIAAPPPPISAPPGPAGAPAPPPAGRMPAYSPPPGSLGARIAAMGATPPPRRGVLRTARAWKDAFVTQIDNTYHPAGVALKDAGVPEPAVATVMRDLELSPTRAAGQAHLVAWDLGQVARDMRKHPSRDLTEPLNEYLMLREADKRIRDLLARPAPSTVNLQGRRIDPATGLAVGYVNPLEMDRPAITRGLADLQARLTPAEWAGVEAAAKRVWAINRSVLDAAHNAGIVSDDAYTTIIGRGDDYVPFRVLDYLGSINQGGVRGPGLRSQDYLRAIEGTERAVARPLDASIDRSVHAVALINANRAGRAITDLSAAFPGVIEHVAGDVFHVPGDRQVVSVFENGERVNYAVPTPIAETMAALSAGQAQVISKLLRATATMLRVGATSHNVFFMLTNVPRDLADAAILARSGFGPIDWARALVVAVRGPKDPLYREVLREGALFTTGQRQFRLLGHQEAEKPGAIAKRASGVTDLRSPKDLARAVFELVGDISSTTEEATKIMTYMRERRAGRAPEEAAYESATYGGSPNFARRGRMIEANLLFNFFNARVQGVSRVSRRAREHPLQVLTRVAAMVVAPALALYAWNAQFDDDHGLEEIQPWERQKYWVILRGETYQASNGETRRKYWRIAKPETAQIVAHGLEQVLDRIRDTHPETFRKLALDMLGNISPISFDVKGEGTAGDVARGVGAGVLANMNPGAAVPLETWFNYNARQQTPLVPRGLAEHLPPQFQRRATTSPVVSAVAKRIGWSPIKLEHAITRSTAGLGQGLIDLLDKAAGKETPETVSGYEKLARQPGFSRVMGLSGGRLDRETEERFYRLLDESQRIVGAARLPERGVPPKEVEEYLTPERMEVGAAHRDLAAMAKELAGIRQAVVFLNFYAKEAGLTTKQRLDGLQDVARQRHAILEGFRAGEKALRGAPAAAKLP